ncbi:MAG: hypothetical protein P8163_14515 [Candidatus Thiodiazotropha sp.]
MLAAFFSFIPGFTPALTMPGPHFKAQLIPSNNLDYLDPWGKWINIALLIERSASFVAATQF